MENKKLTKAEKEAGIKSIEEKSVNGAKEVVIALTDKENKRIEKKLTETAGTILA